MNITWNTNTYRADFDAALEHAYQAFARLYPQWTAYNFDEHFLAHEAAHLLARYRDDCVAPDARHLASAWARQMAWFDAGVRQRRIAELLPAAAHFLCLLKAELTFSAPARQSIPRLDCDQAITAASRSS